MFILLIVLSISGFFTYFYSVHNIINQTVYLFHTFLGLIFIPIIIWYIIIHFIRTLGQRRPTLIISGIIATLLLMGVVFTGIDIFYYGQTETTEWVYDLHIVSSIIAVTLLLLHIVSHQLFLSKRRKEQDKLNYPGIPENLLKNSLLWNMISVALIICFAFVYSISAPVSSSEPVVTPYETTYGNHPFKPSETQTSTGTFIDARQIVGSKGCADCHKDIVSQWQSSAHKQAASDKSYISNISLLAEKKGMAATRYCEGCHAPVALLTGQLTRGGQHGGVPGTDAFNEGVGCLGCHNIKKAVHTKGVASYYYEPHSEYLFALEKGWLKKNIHNLLIKIKPEQHKQDMTRDIIRDPKVCATCHAQFMDKNMNEWGWVKMQDEYTAWIESLYSKQSEQSFSHEQKKRCHDCHMPMIDSNDPSANQKGQVLSHRFPGANTVLPLLENDHEQLLLTQEFLKRNKIRITIEEPRRKDAIQTGKSIDESLRTSSEQPYYFYLNEAVELTIIVTNSGVGHDFPGGTIDINEAWIELSVFDIQGNKIYQSGSIDSQGEVDPESYFYRAIAIDKQGKEVWKHDLFNQIGETYRNVIPAGKSDLVKYRFSIPAFVKGSVTISAVLKYRKFNLRYAKWSLKEKYQKIPVVDVARHSLVVPIKEQPSVR